MPHSDFTDDIDGLEDFQEDAIIHKEENFVHRIVLFKDLHLCDKLQENIRDAAFENPSPVQSIAIPKVLLGMDVLCQAKSGTGKTAVFVLGTLEAFVKNKTRTLVIVHNVEMVEQIKSEYKRFSRGIDVKIEDIYSDCGVSSDILIGTPESIEKVLSEQDRGRFSYGRSHESTANHPFNGIPQASLDFILSNDFSMIVVDECDLIIADLKSLKHIFLNKTILMFTATLTKRSKSECLALLKNPFEIYVDDDSKLTLHGLKQFYLETKESEKIQHLKHIISRKIDQDAEISKMIIFCKRVQNAKFIESQLPNCRAITPYMSMNERISVLNGFKNKEFSILSTTDILSRGIDIQDINIVINYDIPETPQIYLHRVGRAGRFESEGLAINFVNGQIDTIRLNEIMDRYEIDILEYSE